MHRRPREVLGGDQLELVALAVGLASHQLGDRGVDRSRARRSGASRGSARSLPWRRVYRRRARWRRVRTRSWVAWSRPMLELDRLTRRFGATVALDGLSFAVRAGTIFGFVGPNGAGKTTAMRIVLGVLAADAGEVRWRGPAVDADDAPRASATCRRSAACTRRWRAPPARLPRAAARHAPRTRRGRRPTRCWRSSGSPSARTTGSRQLSLGNQQRVQLAAALVHEPGAARARRAVQRARPRRRRRALAGVLRERAAAGATVVFSSHQLELVERLCSAVAIISNGPAGRLRAGRRARGRRRAAALPAWRVEGAPAGWARRRAGRARRRASATASWRWSCDDGADDQALLDAARAAGRVVGVRRACGRAWPTSSARSSRRDVAETVLLVARREFGERVRERSFLVSTLVTVLILGAILVIPTAARPRRRRSRSASASSAPRRPASRRRCRAATLADEPVRVVELPDRAAAERALDDGDVDAVVRRRRSASWSRTS